MLIGLGNAIPSVWFRSIIQIPLLTDLSITFFHLIFSNNEREWTKVIIISNGRFNQQIIHQKWRITTQLIHISACNVSDCLTLSLWLFLSNSKRNKIASSTHSLWMYINSFLFSDTNNEYSVLPSPDPRDLGQRLRWQLVLKWDGTHTVWPVARRRLTRGGWRPGCESRGHEDIRTQPLITEAETEQTRG